MSTRPLVPWLIDAASRDALLSAWHTADSQPLAGFEITVLAAVARAARSGAAITVALPGGHGRLPLLAAAHAAALRLPGFPSPFSAKDGGPVALVTTNVVRRAELADLDAAGVPVSPALHPVRLRADRQVAPLAGGRVCPQDRRHLLLLVSPRAGWAVPEIVPTVAVIDGTDESWQFAADAAAWARSCGAVPVVFADIARGTWLEGSIAFPCGWSQILADESPQDTGVSALAQVRGHAAVLASGPMPGLASSAALLASARRYGEFPSALAEASVLWRRLDELVVPIAVYDAACPRWHTPTLSERLEDLREVRAGDFPPAWRTWAQLGWAGIKDGLASAHAALSTENVKSALLTEAVDADVRAGLAVDIALPSRTARDALIWHLADAGVPVPADGSLIVRSLADPGAWDPPRVTLLAAPPARALRNRLTSADVGPLSILCYDHETAQLQRMLSKALDEPTSVSGPVHKMLPPALAVASALPSQRPLVVLSSVPPAQGPGRLDGGNLPRLADAADIAGLAALKTPPEQPSEDLPDEDDVTQPVPETAGRHFPDRLVPAVPLTVVPLSGGPALLVHVPAEGTAARILDGAVRRMQFRGVLPGMLLVGLDGLTPFDRLRPLLAEARGPVTRMLLTAWDQALGMALRRFGGPTPLAAALGDVPVATVAAWNDDDRIGPREAAHVTQVGELAGHPVVAEHGRAIALTMSHLRRLHQAIGRKVASPGGLNAATADELEQLLGSDALSILAETVIYRVTAVGASIPFPAATMYQPSPITGQPGDEVPQETDDGR